MPAGEAHGEERAVLAAQQAINSPLLQDSSIKGAELTSAAYGSVIGWFPNIFWLYGTKESRYGI